MSRKLIVILDMWSSANVSKGTSKHWLYNQLGKEYDIEIINPGSRIIDDLQLFIRAFNVSRNKWGYKYYRLKEHLSKTPQVFRRRTALFQKILNSMKRKPDIIFQIGGLFGPVGMTGVPYFSYHDQTVRMVEAGNLEWLPDNFSSFKEEWYQLESNFFKNVTHVVTYSNYTRSSVINDYGVDQHRVTAIPTACKLEFPSPDEVFLRRKRQLLFVTTNFYRKGGDILLKAVPEIRKHFPDVRVVIIGGKIPTSVKIDDPAVTYLGVLSLQEMKKYYLESQLLVHPARYDAFPNVLKEAIACGLPVVASNSCGIPEILENGRVGIVLPDLNPTVLADAVVRILQDSSYYRQLQEECLFFREKYRVDTIGEKFLQIFHDAQFH